MTYPDITEALKTLAKETKKPVALLKTNYDAGDQLVVGRVNDLMGIKATSREIHKTKPKTTTTTEAINATSREITDNQNPLKSPRPIYQRTPRLTDAEREELINGLPRIKAETKEEQETYSDGLLVRMWADGQARKTNPETAHVKIYQDTEQNILAYYSAKELKNNKKRGRPSLGAKAMTNAERVRLSRERRKYPDQGYSGKMITTMISGEAHSALDDLLNKYCDLTQKEIIELAIIKLNNKKENDQC